MGSWRVSSRPLSLDPCKVAGPGKLCEQHRAAVVCLLTPRERDELKTPKYPVVNIFKKYLTLTIPEGVARYRGLSPGAKLVFGRLYRYAGPKGYAYPSQVVLAEEVGMSERQAKSYLSELVESDFISIRRQYHTVAIYEFLDHPALHGEVGEARAVKVKVQDAALSFEKVKVQDAAPLEVQHPALSLDAYHYCLEEGHKEEGHTSVGPAQKQSDALQDQNRLQDIDPATGEPLAVSQPHTKRWKKPKAEKAHAKADALRAMRERNGSEPAPYPRHSTAGPSEAVVPPPTPEMPYAAKEWNRVVTAGPPVEDWTHQDRWFNAPASAPEFLKALPKTLDLCQKAFKVRGAEDMGWLNFRWLLKKEKGTGTDNWYRIFSGELWLGKPKPNGHEEEPPDLTENLRKPKWDRFGVRIQ